MPEYSSEISAVFNTRPLLYSVTYFRYKAAQPSLLEIMRDSDYVPYQLHVIEREAGTYVSGIEYLVREAAKIHMFVSEDEAPIPFGRPDRFFTGEDMVRLFDYHTLAIQITGTSPARIGYHRDRLHELIGARAALEKQKLTPLGDMMFKEGIGEQVTYILHEHFPELMP